MFSAVQIYQNIETMMLIRGLSIHKTEIECGLSRGTLNNMRKGSSPSIETLGALADYFGCSIDQLVGREKNIAPVETDKSDLAAALKDLSKDEIVKLIDFAKFLKSQR